MNNPWYETKPLDGEAPALGFGRIWSTLSLLLLQGPLNPGVVAPDRVIFMGQIELWHLNYLQISGLR